MALVPALCLMLASLWLVGGAAAYATGGDDGEPQYSTDRDNPTLVEEVPEGFQQIVATSSVEDCVKTVQAVYSRTTPGEDAVTHEEWYTEERTRTYDPGKEETFRTEYKFERKIPTYADEYRGKYQKYVAGKVQKKTIVGWIDYGTFGFEPYAPPLWGGPTFKTGDWSQSQPAATNGSGGHNSTSATYDERYRKVSQRYEYRLIGTETRQVQTGTRTETTDWVSERPEGEGWEQVDERQVSNEDGVEPSYGEWTEWTLLEDGLLSEPVLPENTDTHEYRKFGPFVVVDEPSSEDITEYVRTVTVSGEPCPEEPKEPKEPHGPATPVDNPAPKAPAPVPVPTVVDAGVGPVESESPLMPVALVAMGTLALAISARRLIRA